MSSPKFVSKMIWVDQWSLIVFISAILFVCGQVFLKKENESVLFKKITVIDILESSCYFALASGVLALLLLFVLRLGFSKNGRGNEKYRIPWYSFFAGIVFFFGNFLWIYAINTSPSIAHVRVLMAGVETILLLLVGVFIFQNTTNVLKPSVLIGIALILVGVIILSIT